MGEAAKKIKVIVVADVALPAEPVEIRTR